MKSMINTLFLVLALSGLSIFGLNGCTDKASDGSGVAESEEAQPLYQCPMHPQITAHEPGTCPICGMDLVLVEEEESAGSEDTMGDMENMEDHSAHQDMKDDDGFEVVNPDGDQAKEKAESPQKHAPVKLSMDKRQVIGVRTEPVGLHKLYQEITAPGRVAFDPELYTAMSEYIEAQKQWHRVKDSPLEEVRRSTREMIRSSRIRLRVLGLSDSQINKLGSSSQPDESLILGKGREGLIYADVFEQQLPYLEPDLPVEVTGPSLKGETLSGRILAVDNVIDPQTRTATVRIALDKAHPDLRPESFVSVHIRSPLGEHVAVPDTAIMDTGQQKIVFVDVGNGRFEPRVVRVKVEGEDWVGVSDGVQVGEAVVVDGNFMLDSESRLKGVLKGQSSDGGSQQGHNH